MKNKDMKTSQDIINYFIKEFKFTRFLEIGVRMNENRLSIDHIICKHKDGVDIAPGRCNYTMTSDKFFQTIPSDQKYNIIYIDGDHEKSQVLKDIDNSLKHLNEGGVILCHDINPHSEKWLAPRFCNNAWETWAKLRCTRSDLEMHALNIDLGPGIIRKGNQELYLSQVEYSWNYLDSNRKKLLNEITIQEFKNIFVNNG
tara:strand:- start:1049 stop:1648 length:600 start_codon:yes stop_codon:yes gene_type:complete